MAEASHLYKKWGAIAKVEYLNEKYPELLSRKSRMQERRRIKETLR